MSFHAYSANQLSDTERPLSRVERVNAADPNRKSQIISSPEVSADLIRRLLVAETLIAIVDLISPSLAGLMGQALLEKNLGRIAGRGHDGKFNGDPCPSNRALNNALFPFQNPAEHLARQFATAWEWGCEPLEDLKVDILKEGGGSNLRVDGTELIGFVAVLAQTWEWSRIEIGVNGPDEVASGSHAPKPGQLVLFDASRPHAFRVPAGTGVLVGISGVIVVRERSPLRICS